MTGSTSRISCKTLFKKSEILTLTSHYVLSLMRFLSSNLEIYKFNTSVHTRRKLKQHKPAVRLNVSEKCLL